MEVSYQAVLVNHHAVFAERLPDSCALFGGRLLAEQTPTFRHFCTLIVETIYGNPRTTPDTCFETHVSVM